MELGASIILISLMIFLLLVFIILLFHKGRENYSNIILGLYFISQILGIFETFYIYLSANSYKVAFTNYPVLFTWVPLFYFYIVALLNGDFRLQWKHAIHFIPFVIVFIYTCIVFYFKPFEIRYALHHSYKIYDTLYGHFSIAFNTQVIAYNIVAIVKYIKYQRSLKDEYSLIDRSANNWLKTALFGFLIGCAITQVGIHFNALPGFNKVNWFLISNGAFFIFFNILFYKAIISPSILLRSNNKEKYRHSSLEQAEAIRLLSVLEKYMDEHKPFAEPNLTLKNLATNLGISERYLSQVINEYKHQNFFDFVNSYRVQYAMELLQDKSNNRRIMLDILFEAGFNSKTTFNTVFKKQTGLTPTDYKRKCG